jgi:hypothetical protein
MSPQVLIARRHRRMDFLCDSAILEVQRSDTRVLEQTLEQTGDQCRRSDAHRRLEKIWRTSSGGSMTIILRRSKMDISRMSPFGRLCFSAARFRCLRMGLATKCCLLSPEWLFLTGRFCSKAAVRRNVRCWVNNGKHLLALSFSAFDPERTLVTCARKAWACWNRLDSQQYFLTAASMLLPALAKSSGTITG